MLEHGRMRSFCTMGQKDKNKFSFLIQDFHSSKMFLHNMIIDSENTAECIAFAQWVKKVKQI